MRLFPELTWSVVPVKNGESEEGSVAVGSEGGFGQGGQVVHVVESWAVCVIVARQQQVHMIRSLCGGGYRVNIQEVCDAREPKCLLQLFSTSV